MLKQMFSEHSGRDLLWSPSLGNGMILTPAMALSRNSLATARLCVEAGMDSLINSHRFEEAA
jgi:hypothetical protein